MATDISIVARQRAIYWRRVQRLTLYSLLAWFAITFIILFFARELSGLTIFGWPFPFYMAAQGMVLIYLLIVAIYVWRMRRLDRLVTDEGNHGH